jgi:hypothetical protein
MLNPSKTGWIKKYLSLAERGAFAPEVFMEQNLSSEKSVIQFLTESGIIFGVFGKFIFLKDQGEEQWTTHEKLKVLYFEALLLIYKHTYPNQKDLNVFLATIEAFYKDTAKFEELYVKYEKQKGLRKKTMSAEEVFKSGILKERTDTGRIYLVFIDNVQNQGPFDP